MIILFTLLWVQSLNEGLFHWICTIIYWQRSLFIFAYNTFYIIILRNLFFLFVVKVIKLSIKTAKDEFSTKGFYEKPSSVVRYNLSKSLGLAQKPLNRVLSNLAIDVTFILGLPSKAQKSEHFDFWIIVSEMFI